MGGQGRLGDTTDDGQFGLEMRTGWLAPAD